jgi:2-oxo-3-hexenedioate decarboxylase
MLDRLADDPAGRALKAGDLITTGTVTRAFPVKPGDVWSTTIDGLDVPALSAAIVG